MTYREEPLRRAADPEPRTTPLPTGTTRSRHAGRHALSEPATGKIAVPSQRNAPPRSTPAESPWRASVELHRSRAAKFSERASVESPRTKPADSPRTTPADSPWRPPPESPRTTPADRTHDATQQTRNEPATSKIAAPIPRNEPPRTAPADPAPTESPLTTPAESASSTPAERQRGTEASRAPKPRARVLVGSVLIGALVSVALGVYGRLHEPTGYAVNVAGFSSAAYAKAWLASVAAVFAVLQPISAAVMYRRKRGGPRWVAFLHRWSGRIAVLVSIPVAMHCLFAFGFQLGSTRVLAHSLAGCVFYGAFTTKMLSLARPGTPRWAVPLFGGLVFTVLVALWLSSALWLFGKQGIHA